MRVFQSFPLASFLQLAVLGCFQQVSHHVAHAEKQSRCASRGYCSTIQQDADAARKKGVGPRHTAYSLVLSPHLILSLLASSTRTQPRPLAGGKSRLFCEAASASRWNGPFLIAMQVVGHGADLIRFTHAQPRPAGNSLTCNFVDRRRVLASNKSIGNRREHIYGAETRHACTTDLGGGAVSFRASCARHVMHSCLGGWAGKETAS